MTTGEGAAATPATDAGDGTGVLDPSLAAALEPRSVAVIGASEDRTKAGGRSVEHLLRFGFTGAVYPVHPQRSRIQGLPAYPDVAALPAAPDLAVIALPGADAAAAVDACAAKGVRTAIVLASGFGEVGADGARLQQQMAERARRAGMRIVGPNSQGLARFSAGGAVANFSSLFAEVSPLDGPIAIVSQSGATAAALYGRLRLQGLGVRYVLATGNEADVTVAELALHVLADAAVRLVVVYAESLRDPARLAAAAVVARQRDVPLVVLKAGRSARGAALAQSHTGALLGTDAVVEAFLRHHGIVRVDDLDAVVDAAPLWLEPRPHGRKLVLVSNSGASGVLCADLADRLGMPLAIFSADTAARLGTALGARVPAGNPIDLAGSAVSDPTLVGRVLQVLGDEPEGDLVLISFPVAGAGYDLDRFAGEAAAFRDGTGRTVVASATLPSSLEPFRRHGIVGFQSETRALAALDLVSAGAVLHAEPRQPAETPRPPPDVPEGRGFLDEAASLSLLAGAGVQVVDFETCDSAEHALAAFHRLGGHVVVKACSESLPHKSEHGLVHLAVRTESGVHEAYGACRAGMAALGVAGGRVLVARMERGRRELAVGAKLDPSFGPVVMVGDGGTYIEALPDFAVLMPPFDAAEVERAVRGLRIGPLFRGVRGEPPMDLQALTVLVRAVAELMVGAAGRIVALDLNPVLVRSAGDGVVTLDALVDRGEGRR